MEVEEVVRRFGYAVTLAYAEHLLRDLLP
jgi:hypothetical protein